MPVVIEADSDGNDHQIWKQEQANSCAIASIWMARSIAFQRSIDESEWDLAVRTFQTAIQSATFAGPAPATPAPQTFDENAFGATQNSLGSTFGTFGTMATQVANMLRQEGLTVTHSANSGTAQAITTANLAQARPAIVLVGWYSSVGGTNVRRGGHFVVAVGQNSTNQIIYLDPWDGTVVEQANNRRYPGGGLIEEVIYLQAP